MIFKRKLLFRKYPASREIDFFIPCRYTGVIGKKPGNGKIWELMVS